MALALIDWSLAMPLRTGEKELQTAIMFFTFIIFTVFCFP
jgi:hypothetical protein